MSGRPFFFGIVQGPPAEAGGPANQYLIFSVTP